MSTSPKSKLVILISGSGSNLQSFIDAVNSGDLNAEIAAVFCNKPNAFGLSRAADAGIQTEVIDHTKYDSRDAFDTAMMNRINEYSPDLLILAGFMRILTPSFVQQFQGKLLNIHPSLLPKYPGLNTHQRALDAGDKHTGATVHFVTDELDGGPAILQARVEVEPLDTVDRLASRILAEEHKIYPLAAQWFAEGRLKLEKNYATLDNKKLPLGGKHFSDGTCQET
ncbi:MAG: phosphoribosylglycinamide formyltransferase [Oceanicoccus sp.]